ncbi:hypothetical protein GCM10011573_17260 [Enterococcus wangshanyuanii]|uniref:NTP pyrophosphohydrolase MazG-like domain-containing protein n=1 Tax=Enterococcus wangshanyuanii TaxID=2005703 RepID=A0ABQ1P0A6_9ENTE|nr:hypothetical protein GCM10011573_17260 [Enterococcus wangshanyuanii]
MDKLIELVEEWSKNKRLDQADSSKQMLKVTEEVGEVAAAIARNDQDLLRDAIGDTVVTLIILAQQNDMDLYECLTCAYDVIKGRTGKTVDGVFVKSEDLEKKKLSQEKWNKLSPREKLLHAGYSEEQLDQMVKEYPDEDPDELFTDELSYAAENSR